MPEVSCAERDSFLNCHCELSRNRAVSYTHLLRAEGYRVSDSPSIFSPHLLPREAGGRPQVRERVFVTASRLPEGRGLEVFAEPAVANRPIAGWDPQGWHLEGDLPLDDNHNVRGCDLSKAERLWIDAWDDFVQLMWEERGGRRLSLIHI